MLLLEPNQIKICKFQICIPVLGNYKNVHLNVNENNAMYIKKCDHKLCPIVKSLIACIYKNINSAVLYIRVKFCYTLLNIK